jgi:hypothetical protein
VHHHKIVLALLVGTAASGAHAGGCWRIAELKGQSARALDGFAISGDGYSNKEFRVAVDGKTGAVSPSNMSCMAAGATSVLCVDRTAEGKLTIETWAIDEQRGKVIHTKAISGYGPHDGGNLFIGKVVGPCSGG